MSNKFYSDGGKKVEEQGAPICAPRMIASEHSDKDFTIGTGSGDLKISTTGTVVINPDGTITYPDGTVVAPNPPLDYSNPYVPYVPYDPYPAPVPTDPTISPFTIAAPQDALIDNLKACIGGLGRTVLAEILAYGLEPEELEGLRAAVKAAARRATKAAVETKEEDEETALQKRIQKKLKKRGM